MVNAARRRRLPPPATERALAGRSRIGDRGCVASRTEEDEVTAIARERQAAEATRESALGDLAIALDHSGLLYLPDHRAVVVADLHLEKGSARAARGAFLPPYDTRETLARLAHAIAPFAPRVLIALGDSFHDVGGPDRLGEAERAGLAAIAQGREMVWVTGNHDATLPASLGGSVVAALALDGVRLAHEPSATNEPATSAPVAREICGHLHPAAKVRLRGRAVRRRAFARDGRLLVMPAFGAYAGGLDVCDPAIAGLFPYGFRAHILGESRIFSVDSRLLTPDTVGSRKF